MIKYRNEEKEKINILLNPDDYYGRSGGNIGRILIFCIVACTPFFLYALFFSSFIKIWIFAIMYIPYVIWCALTVIGRQKERIESFKKIRNNVYEIAKDLIKILDIRSDGLVEYMNGTITYIIEAYPHSYMDDSQYAHDLEEFIQKLFTTFDRVDIMGQMVVGELGTTQEDLEKLKVYKDEEFLNERLNFYKYQDKYADDNTTLFRYVFVIKAYKSQWGRLHREVYNIVNSELVKCFYSVRVCVKNEVNDIISRDATFYVDLNEMLRNKLTTDKYFGSKVLYFGDEVPDDIKVKEDSFTEEDGRRVIYDK